MDAKVLPIEMIVSDPKIRAGRPTIAGTNICVAYVVARYNHEGLTPENIAIQYNLSLGQVHAALAHYYTHKKSIDEEMRRDAEDARQLFDSFKAQGKLITLD